VGGVLPPVCDVPTVVGAPADDSLGSCDPEEEEEEDRNLSGVSDISSGSINRELVSPGHAGFTGPKTPPPLSGETTPSSGPAGVSDISSDNIEPHSADVSISETSLDADGGPALGSRMEMDMGGVAASSVPQVFGADGEGTLAGEDGKFALVERGMEMSGGGGGRETGAEDEGSDAGVISVLPPPLFPVLPLDGGVESEGGVALRRPPLESLMGGGVAAPPSPPSAQGTPSKTPGKRKVSRWRNVSLVSP
jgi:hypothetical protein